MQIALEHRLIIRPGSQRGASGHKGLPRGSLLTCQNGDGGHDDQQLNPSAATSNYRK